jgi:hypothetical protein
LTGRPSIPDVLAGLCEVARPIMRECVGPDSCIAMTFVACEALNHFGFVTAVPLNVEAIILNRVFRDGLESGRLDWERKLTEDDLDAGAWSVALGLEAQRQEKLARGERAGGHVVAVLGKYLIDLSLDQASRPHKGIVLTPLVFEFDAVVEAGATWTYSLNDGDCYVEYKLRPDLETWRDSPDWRQGRKRYRSQVGRIVRAIRNG